MSDVDAPVTLRAHAKLTLGLRITGVTDRGYHLLDAEMVSLDLHDVLTIDPARRGIEVSGPFSDGVPTDGTNLVSRALTMVDRTAHVEIAKEIPPGGGLGGGSTDAAAVLRWGGLGSGPADLVAASRLGADIPFCLIGGRARVTGVGEIVEPLEHRDREFTLIIPPLAVPTPAAYRAWDDLGGPTGDGPNDLEPAALAVEPRMAWWRDAIADRIGEPPVLAGSGATWFTERSFSPEERDNALGDLVGEGARVLVTKAVGSTAAT